LSELNIKIEGVEPIEISGINNSKLKILESHFSNVQCTLRGENLWLKGESDDVEKFKNVVQSMVEIVHQRGHVTIQNIEELLIGVHPLASKLNNDKENGILHSKDGKLILAKTKNQKAIVEASLSNDIVFAVGPAGTGKTYTAVALAVRALKNKEVKRIILTRPAVEAGESLGFLPGDLQEKVDPYLRPLYDALDDMITADKLATFREQRIIEVAPLAYMRGRTLDKSFIILDEAQNCTSSQLKMFLTRMGPEAKCIITGDLSQIDLPRNQKSGLNTALQLLKDIKGIATVYLDESDVIRHRLVKQIIKAYEHLNDYEH